jgi:hypothetical protein
VTPESRLELSKNVVQYPIDITRTASSKRFRELLRGVLASRPECRKVGVITHSTLATTAEQLGPQFDCRIEMVRYFGSGSDRGSNEWLEAKCDLIIVAGTPRVNDIEIQKLLYRCGHLDAIRQGGQWGELAWQGVTTSGSPRVIKGRGYQHPLWRQAHRSKVRAAIVQAAGRARALLPTGCDAVILSTEECGYPVAEFGQDVTPLTDSEAAVLVELTAVVSLIPIRNNRRCALTSDIVKRTRLSDRQVRDILRRLECRGLVLRVGERGGWMLPAEPAASATQDS